MSDVEDISDYERLRHKNLKELEQFMCSFDDSGLDDESLEALRYLSKKEHEVITKPTRRRKRESDDDKTFKFTGQLPLYSRRSARLSNLPPEYTYTELEDEDITIRDSLLYKKHNRGISELENVISKPRRSYSGSRHAEAVFVAANEITDDYIANIAGRGTIKIYSSNGTCCHQCRQKTLDSKTYCRSGRCVGVRGQFCGVCLKNRYGEDAAVVLKDPTWECPPCRGLCNCSICRAKEGKCPTGILAPIAFRHGHKSVKDFLMSLKGEGDYIHKAPSKAPARKQSEQSSIENDLLGFDADLNPVWVARGSSEEGDLLGFSTDGEAVLTEKYFY